MTGPPPTYAAITPKTYLGADRGAGTYARAAPTSARTAGRPGLRAYVFTFGP